MSGSEVGRSARGLGVVSDKPQAQVPVPVQRNGRGAGRELKKEQRLKREDHVYVKHDDCFSDWKILVGPTDWKEHASGKIPDRFRISNLPSKHTGAGLYELGVTPPAWLPPHNLLGPHDVVVVYLGSAENVHQRLLKYGQTGAHLEGIRSTRLFAVRAEERDVGDGGYVSRPVSNASLDANEDGGWEVKNGDHARSPGRGSRLFSEVFALGCSVAFRWTLTDSKADAERAEALLISHFDYAWKRGGNFRQRSSDIVSKIVGSHSSSPSCFSWLFSTRPGVPIPARKPSKPPTPRHFTLFRTTTPTTTKSSKQREFTKLDIPLDRCGAPSCHALPVKGGKRCLLHKDLKSKSAIAPNPNFNPNPHTDSHLLGGVESPILPGPDPRPAPMSSCFPFISPAIAAPSSSSSPKRRGSLSFTSWLRTSEIRMATRAETGPKRSSSTLTTCEENESPSSRSRREICGLRLEDGTVCPDPPRPDRKRCEAHKGLRNQAPRSPRSAAMSPAGSAPMSPNAGFF